MIISVQPQGKVVTSRAPLSPEILCCSTLYNDVVCFFLTEREEEEKNPQKSDIVLVTIQLANTYRTRQESTEGNHLVLYSPNKYGLLSSQIYLIFVSK